MSIISAKFQKKLIKIFFQCRLGAKWDIFSWHPCLADILQELYFLHQQYFFRLPVTFYNVISFTPSGFWSCNIVFKTFMKLNSLVILARKWVSKLWVTGCQQFLPQKNSHIQGKFKKSKLSKSFFIYSHASTAMEDRRSTSVCLLYGQLS